MGCRYVNWRVPCLCFVAINTERNYNVFVMMSYVEAQLCLFVEIIFFFIAYVFKTYI